ncbi:MAG: hypothetical protein AB7S68_42070 [Polyangiaceae bacterium]
MRLRIALLLRTALLAIAAVCGCQSVSESPQSVPSADAGGPASGPPSIESPWNQPVPSGVHKPEPFPALGFASSASGSLVVFELMTGSVVAEHPLGNTVFDLAWLPGACRLMARVSSNGRAQRVFAYEPRWESGQLQLALRSATEEYWGDPQILGVRSYVSTSGQRRPETLWLTQGDPVPVWQRLGSELELLSPGAAWPAPVRWSTLPQGNVVGIVGKAEATEVAFATLDGSQEHFESYALPHAAVLATRGADLWVWQAAGADAGPRLLRYAALAPLGAPSFEQPYLGNAEALALEAAPHRAVALLETPRGGLSLWSAGQGTAYGTRVDAPVTHRYRPLALQPHAAWLATDTGVLQFSLPQLNANRVFNGAELRGPVLVPGGKELRCLSRT